MMLKQRISILSMLCLMLALTACGMNKGANMPTATDCQRSEDRRSESDEA